MQASNLEIIKLNNLKLAAKIISEQLKNGVHLGKRVGVGSEFEQYRYYEPGDDPKRIDWKYFSRSGKYMIKESQTESHLHIRMMLDLSGSMNYEENGIKRLDYAKNLIASLSYLAHQQGDSLSYFTCQDGKVVQKVAASPKAFQRMLYYLEEEAAAGSWPIVKQDFPALKSRQKELIILVSDFLQKDNEWLDIVEQMRHPKKEIVLFQILGKQEEEFDLKGNFNFKDLESDRTVILDHQSIEKNYNESIKNYLSDFKQSLLLPKVHLFQVRLTDSIAEVISKFLSQRTLF
ncbi:uncharacterized protein (DUF58 family) [Algoriphagus sp. 4150]|uniref:DUF58 domain-containing protein n=1 Tax=Algoriphagus sp. 4150 TaxID=2817756 RepID=UPI00285C87CD|nr:DUF58 domain-containing protein [Algoriphagus sp. 4150]MDR7130125.1 uncharacterized protein (DUF58 family) [Algoriphagus sp. 4150]